MNIATSSSAASQTLNLTDGRSASATYVRGRQR